MKSKNVVVKNQVILNAIQDLQHSSLLLFNNIRGRGQIKFGMTALLNNGGFTLIELLVVVLIIGILAAVAVPQYQKAVLKSRYATIKNLVKSVATAQEVYYLSHGKYATLWSDLDIDISSNCTNSSCSFDWGSCNIAISTSDYMVSCILIAKEHSLRYGLWLAHSPSFPGRAQCFAGTKDLTDITNKICKIETQTKYPAYFPSENSSAWLYN